MKLKLDEDGKVVVVDGKPVYVHSDGKEIPFDGQMAFDKIKELNTENKDWREKHDGVSAQLSAFEGIDPVKAKNALDTVQNLDDKKLVDANDIEVLKTSLNESYQQNLEDTKKSYQTKIDELSSKISIQESNIDELLVLGAFERSSFLSEKTNLTPDIAYARFKEGLKVEYTEKGKPFVVGYVDGEKLYSRKDPGKIASPEESIEMIIQAYPLKDNIMKGRSGGGSGGGPGSGSMDGEDITSQYAAAQKAGNVALMVALKRQMSAKAS